MTDHITLPRAEAERVLEDLASATDDGYDFWASITALKAALAELVREQVVLEGHCLWARNGKDPCPHVQKAQQEPVQEPVAWMHPEDGRVIPAATMNTALRDGGASLSSVSGFTVALGVIRKRHAAIAKVEGKPCA